MSDSELFYQLALTLVPGVGPVAGKSLIGYCGSAEAVFTERKSVLKRIPGISDTLVQSIASFQDFHLVESELRFIEANEIRAIGFTDKQYPMRLKQEMDGPLVLFVKGETNFNHDRVIGIVGTRRSTPYGQAMTKKLVDELKPFGVHTISGMAYGIDIAAHKASLAEDIPTLAVVAHGLDKLYPGQHKSHARRMIENGGAIISEHFSGTALNPDLFPRRNRIVAAMCDALVVVESQQRGGSMITADIAAGYNREVFAVPGRSGDAFSEGCNYLIKNLKAMMCESASDIVKELNWQPIDSKKPEQPRQNKLFETLSAEESSIANYLQSGIKNFESILIETGIPINRLSYLLIDLEMRGILSNHPGKCYGLT